jgi:hypothetical protein
VAGCVVATDPGIGDAVVLGGEGVIVAGALEEDADELVAERLSGDAHALDEGVELVMGAFEAIGLLAGPVGVGLGEHDVAAGLVWGEAGADGGTGGFEGRAVGRERFGVVARGDGQGDGRSVRYLRWRRGVAGGHERGYPCGTEPSMKKRFHIVQIVVSAMLVQQAWGDELDPFLLEPPGEAAPTAPSAPVTPTADKRRLPTVISSWSKWLKTEMAEPVFDATAGEDGGWVAVVGGFDRGLKAVPYVQLHHREDGWIPIASQLKEARARHAMVRLKDGSWFVCGGVKGSIGGGLEALASCEIVRLPVAGSVEAPPMDEPVGRPTAHLLKDGRVAVAGGSRVKVFDPETMGWGEAVGLRHARADQASVLLKSGTMLVIGGDERGTIEAIDWRSGNPVAELWEAGLGSAISRCAAAELADGRVVVVGGFDAETGRTVSSTWVLDPETKRVKAGPRLPLERGVAGAQVSARGGEAQILGGEWREGLARGEAGAALVVRVDEREAVWRLKGMPTALCAGAWVTLRGEAAVVGGYRFVVGRGAEVSGGSWRVRSEARAGVGD